MQKIIITTGGTGGHIFPALAVAEEITRRFPDCDILFLGGKYGPERELAGRAGLRFVGLPVRGMLGRGLRAIPAALAMLYAILRAIIIVARFRPDIVVGFGGYAAFAGVLAARLCGRPTAIHEQNSIAGLVNRVLGKIVHKVFLSLGKKDKFFGHSSLPFPAKKMVFTGNPVRASIVEAGLAPLALEKQRHLLVMGGSLGATAINDAIIDALPHLKVAIEAGGHNLFILHQTGKADYERVSNAYARAEYVCARVVPFIDDMAAEYAWADVAMCRAGATSIAELTVAGVPSILVPFPFASHDHQLHNAAYVASHGAAVLLEQKDILSVDVAAMILDLTHDSQRLEDMSRFAKQLAHPHAAAKLVDELVAMIKEKA